MSGVAALAYSSHLRDQYAAFEVDTLDDHDFFRTLGLVLGGTVLAARLVSFFVYGGSDTVVTKASAPPNGAGARGRLSVGANGLGLQF